MRLCGHHVQAYSQRLRCCTGAGTVAAPSCSPNSNPPGRPRARRRASRTRPRRGWWPRRRRSWTPCGARRSRSRAWTPSAATCSPRCRPRRRRAPRTLTPCAPRIRAQPAAAESRRRQPGRASAVRSVRHARMCAAFAAPRVRSAARSLRAACWCAGGARRCVMHQAAESRLAESPAAESRLGTLKQTLPAARPRGCRLTGRGPGRAARSWARTAARR